MSHLIITDILNQDEDVENVQEDSVHLRVSESQSRLG